VTIDDDKAVVRSLYQSGLTIHEIAKQVKKSPGWVYSTLQTGREKRPTSSRNRLTSLTTRSSPKK
jgi:transposase